MAPRAEGGRRQDAAAAGRAGGRGAADSPVQLTDEELAAIRARLHRIQGQTGGILRMIEQGRDCRQIVTQVAAVRAALDRIGFTLLNSALQQCARDPDATPADLAALEKLFVDLS